MGLSQTWILRWRDTLTITQDYIAANPCFVATDEWGEGLGFATLREEAGAVWIDHLWVLPARMGRGDWLAPV